MQIPSISMDSLLPVTNQGAAPASEGGDFARSLRERQDSLSPPEKDASAGSSRPEPSPNRQKNDVVKESGRARPEERRSGSDSRGPSAEAERPNEARRPDPEPARPEGNARPAAAEVPAVPVDAAASLSNPEQVPVAEQAASSALAEVPVPELPALSQIPPEIVPEVANVPALPETAAVAAPDARAESGPTPVAEPSMQSILTAAPMVPAADAPPAGAEVRGAAENIPVQPSEPPAVEAHGVARPARAVRVAEAPRGASAESEIPGELRSSERPLIQESVPRQATENPRIPGSPAADVTPIVSLPPGVGAKTPVSSEIPVMPLSEGDVPFVAANPVTQPPVQSAEGSPLSPPGAEVAPAAAAPKEAPAAVVVEPRNAEVFIRRGGQEPPVSEALPAGDGKAVVESLRVSPRVMAAQGRPLAEAVVAAVAAATPETVQPQVAAPLRKTPLVKMATTADTSDRRFAQLLGDKTVAPSAPVVESVTAAKLPPPAVAADPARPAEKAVERPARPLAEPSPPTGNDAAAKSLAEASGFGLPREAAPAPVGQPLQADTAPPLAAGGQPAPPSVSSAPPTAIAGPSPPLPPTVAEENIYRQVAGRISLVAGERHSRITMKLYPEELGQVKLEMAVEGDRVRIQLHAQTQQVQEVLEKYLPKLRESFEQQGLKLDDVQVSSDSPQQGGKGFHQDSRPSPQASRQVARLAQGEDESAVDLAATSRSAVRPGGINVRI